LTTPDQNPDDDEGSVTRVIRRMQSGEADGATLLWKRFYSKLRLLVRDRLYSRTRTLSDDEDVALDSLAELFQGLLQGQYPQLDSRESLWKLLVTVAWRNVMDEVTRERRLKRGGGRVITESGLGDASQEQSGMLSSVPGDTLAPDVKIMIAERCTEMLEALEDEQLQAIALLKTSGCTHQEVADRLGISLRSVERRIAEIRDCWSTGALERSHCCMNHELASGGFAPEQSRRR
jgi:DNA-directed RNA polymerase specialized sigma24 family protein